MPGALRYMKCVAKALAKSLGKHAAVKAGVPEHYADLPIDIVVEWAEHLFEDWQKSPAEFIEAQRDLIAPGHDLTDEDLNQALDAAFLGQPEPIRMTGLALLAQVQSQTRQSLKRREDPTGTSLPADHSINSPDDLIVALPTSIPRFKKGDRPIQGWVLGDRLGGGGMGEVYIAHNPTRPNLTTAIKFFLDPRARDWLASHEAGVVEYVQNHVFHQGIVRLQNIYDDLACLQFECVKGWPLSRQILDWKIAGENDPTFIATEFRKIVEILENVHLIKPHPIVHRDIKPANILVEPVPNGLPRYRITDFGIGGYAVAETVRKTRIGTRTGPRNPSLFRGSATELYASPQQLTGADADPRDDIYSLGVVWYQMQTGQLRQKPGPDWAEDLREDPHHPVPEQILAVMATCFATKPDRRPANARELLEKLDHLLGTPVPDPPRTPPAPPTEARHEPAPNVIATKTTEKPLKPTTFSAIWEDPDVFRALFAKPEANSAPPAQSKPSPELITTKTAEIPFKLIPAGTFMMGSPDGKGEDDERPQHKVTITKPFYMGATPITQAQYAKLMGKNPSYFSSTGAGKKRVAGIKTSHFPIESVNWLEAAQFCNALSKAEGLELYYQINGERVEIINRDGKGFRLPYEAEWEYCARAGHQGEYGFDGDVNLLSRYAWYKENSDERTHWVGQLRPNDLGLYDMLGNVWEWTWDGYEADYYIRSPALDPPGPDQALNRVNRGGNWVGSSALTRVAGRGSDAPNIRYCNLGFRVARVQ